MLKTTGIFWFLVHCFIFAVLSAITKHLLDRIYIFEIIFFEAALSTLFIAPFIIFKFKIKPTESEMKWHALRSFLWIMATAMYFYAVGIINLPKAVALSFSVPLFTTILSVIILKEKLYIQRVLALIFGIIGMIIIIRPGISEYESASLWVIGAAFLWSVTDIIIKVLSQKNHAAVQTFYFSAFCTLFSFPLAFIYWTVPEFSDLLWLIGMSVIFTINMFCVSKAYEKSDLTIIKPFAFTQLIFVSIIAYIFFGEVISAYTLFGSIIIVCSTFYMMHREKKLHKQFLARQIGNKLMK